MRCKLMLPVLPDCEDVILKWESLFLKNLKGLEIILSSKGISVFPASLIISCSKHSSVRIEKTMPSCCDK